MASHHQWRVPTEAKAVSGLRRTVMSYARTHDVPDPPLEDLQIALGEALANTVMHGRSPAGTVAVEMLVDADADQVRVRVLDDGPGLRAKTPSPGLGLGTRLMTILADHLSIREREGKPGTEVDMTFKLGIAS